jgi:hypothetical protein
VKTHSFTLELPSGTSNIEAERKGLEHIGLRPHADFSVRGSKPHPAMSGTRIFTFSYKA